MTDEQKRDLDLLILERLHVHHPLRTKSALLRSEVIHDPRLSFDVTTEAYKHALASLCARDLAQHFKDTAEYCLTLTGEAAYQTWKYPKNKVEALRSVLMELANELAVSGKNCKLVVLRDDVRATFEGDVTGEFKVEVTGK